MNTLNIHPLFVHFPIALLILYTVLEIFRLPILTRQQWNFYTKAVLLFTGIAGGFVSLQTGEWAERTYRGTPEMSLIHLHSTYAVAAMWVYGILGVLYFAEWVYRSNVLSSLPAGMAKAWNALRVIDKTLFKTPLLILLSVIGLVLITITGALGGAIVYGPTIDPVVSFFYTLLYKQ